ncbi:efflux RND transporter periplasmic adaptor subunit [Candidatus Laterigemmans baculatus]|uniref:efflux RND transporter periplasmic adaptor subunit n=1 Tax=Candidatus Laterigemmans baculatus TaxID=2770505 RepID=UPI0013DB8EFF|nr:efflux RND transporter periplasmic adaptor subunit [Candidatus Laterigemmans baculatus]
MQMTASRTTASPLPGALLQRLMVSALAVVCWAGAPPVELSAQSLQFDGFVEPLEDIHVAALEMGNLKEVRVRIGDRVEAGDVIAVLDDSLQAAAVEVARLQMEMRGPLEAAAAERELHAARLERLQSLRLEGLARPDELKRAEADLKIAEARLLTVEEERQLRAAELKRCELQLSRRLIRAPITGTVAHVFRKTGEFVSPSDPAVVHLIATDQLVAVVSIPAEYAAGVRQGTFVRVRLSTVPSELTAHVQTIAPAIEGESGTVQIRILLPNPEGRLKAGDRCTVTFPNGSGQTSNLRASR